MTVDDHVTRQFHRAASSIPAPAADLVDASITDGRRRLRRRGRRRMLGSVLGAVVISSGATYVVSQDEPAPTAEMAAPHRSGGYTSPAADAAVLLARRLRSTQPAQVAPEGHRPGWLVALWAETGVPPGLTIADQGQSRLLTLTATTKDGATRAALLMTDALSPAGRTELLARCTAPQPAPCLRSDLGTAVILNQDDAGPTAVNLITPDGWLVQAVAEDSRVISALRLTQTVLDGGWLR